MTDWEAKICTLASQNGWILVAISGTTNSGKTTLVNRLTENIPSVVINQDDYFRNTDDPNHVWIELQPTGRYINWEVLECIDWEAMCERVCQIVSQPAPGGKSFVLIDGHIVLNYKALAATCAVKFFIKLDKETVRSRRILRTDQPDPPGYFDQWTWPMHEMNKKAIQEQTIYYINGNQDLDVILSETLNKLKSYL